MENIENQNLLYLYNLIASRISCYLSAHDIYTDDIYYERSQDGTSSLAVKIGKGLKEKENYILFTFKIINNDVDFNITNSKKNYRPTLFLVRYLSEEIINFFMNMEEELLKSNLNNNYFIIQSEDYLAKNLNKEKSIKHI